MEVLDIVRESLRKMAARDPYLYWHCRRVGRLSQSLCRGLDIPESHLKSVATAAALHDIGILSLSRATTSADLRLTVEEHLEMRRRPVVGAAILREYRAPEEVIRMVECHHENLDGSGYPYELKGEEIPLGARIISVANVYDSMTTVRPYGSQLSGWDALQLIRQESGTRYDPMVVASLERFVQRLR